MKPEVKICGLTLAQDVEAVNEAGADYAGFVFFEKSKRNISLEQANELMRRLKPGIKKVAVTVAPEDALLDALNQMDFDFVQMHGNVTAHMIEKSRHPVWQAVNMAHPEKLEDILLDMDQIKGYVLDAASYGSGQTFSWESTSSESLRKQMAGRKMILAGGLNPENVREGIRLFSPDVVDVSSGVEKAQGIGKEKQKVIDFVKKSKTE